MILWVKKSWTNTLKVDKAHYISQLTPGYCILIGQNFLKIKKFEWFECVERWVRCVWFGLWLFLCTLVYVPVVLLRMCHVVLLCLFLIVCIFLACDLVFFLCVNGYIVCLKFEFVSYTDVRTTIFLLLFDHRSQVTHSRPAEYLLQRSDAKEHSS